MPVSGAGALTSTASTEPRSGFFSGWAMMLMYFVFTPGSQSR